MFEHTLVLLPSLTPWLSSECCFSEQERKQTWGAGRKTAEEAELQQICKVAESGWVGQSPSSRRFIPSRSKNSSGDQSGARTDAEIGRILSVFFGRASTLRGDGPYSSPSTGIKTKGEIRPRSHRLGSDSHANNSTSICRQQKEQTNTRNHAQEARKHAKCILCRLVW